MLAGLLWLASCSSSPKSRDYTGYMTRPYTIRGHRYHPMSVEQALSYEQTGIASHWPDPSLQHVLRGLEMHLGHLRKHLLPMLGHQLASGLYHLAGSPPSGSFMPAASPAASIQFTKRSRARMDAAATATSLSARTRCSSLMDSFFGRQGPFQYKRIGKLVAQRHGAVRHLGRQALNHRGMPPGQKTVQILELRIKLVVPLRADAHQMEPDAGHPAYPFRQGTDSGGRTHQLAVTDAQLAQRGAYAPGRNARRGIMEAFKTVPVKQNPPASRG